MFEPKEMAVRIKTAAKVNGIKLSDMWRDLNLSNNTLHNMNNGSTPSIGTLVMISQYLGVPSDYIIGEKIKITPDSNTGSDEKPIDDYFVSLSKMSMNELLELLDNLTKELQKRQNNQAK